MPKSLLRLLTGLLLWAPLIVTGEDLVTKSGLRYRNVDVIEANPLGFKFSSEGNTYWINFEDLPEAVALSYGYDRHKAEIMERKLASEGDRTLIFPDELNTDTRQTAMPNQVEIIRLDNGLPVIYQQGMFHHPLPWWSYRHAGFRLNPLLADGDWKWNGPVKYWNGIFYPFADVDFVIPGPSSLSGARAPWVSPFPNGWCCVRSTRNMAPGERWKFPTNSISTQLKLLYDTHDFNRNAILIEESKTDRNLHFREVKRIPTSELLSDRTEKKR